MLTWSLSAEDALSLNKFLGESHAEFYWDSAAQKGQIYLQDKTAFFMFKPYAMININGRLFPKKGSVNMAENGLITFSPEVYKQLTQEFSVEKPLWGFSVNRIIIDAGHGGKDHGAIGRLGRYPFQEKNLVLEVSLRLANKLRQTYPDIEIVLTRDDDTYLTLQERIDIANVDSIDSKEISLFISIHANASLNTKASGFEIWYLPQDYSRQVINPNEYANETPSVRKVINALWQAEFLNESQRLASSLLQGLDDEVGDLSPNRGLKAEEWFVVRNARMASVLVELGFITNKKEYLHLRDNVYLEKLTKGLYNGIEEFINEVTSE